MMKHVMFRTVSLILAFLVLCLLESSIGIAATLTADTSRPEHSTFAIGESVKVLFKSEGLAPSSVTTLSVVVKDAHDAVIASTSIPVTASASGSWTSEYSPPCERLGFYRVFPSLADGTTLPKLFTRQAGYITYAVVPDPARRFDYGEMDSIFGMVGGFNSGVNIIPYLGVRWVFGSLGWATLEKNHPGQFAQDRALAIAKGQKYPPPSLAVEGLSFNGRPWNTYVLPMMRGVPAWAGYPGKESSANSPILPAAEGAYCSFCQEAAKAFDANYPQYKQHLYQITAEPVYPWGYSGTDQQLVRIYELAYPAIHKTDPTARVLGPTAGGLGDEDAAWTERLFALGLGKYLDGVSIDAYFRLPPEGYGMVKAIQDVKDIIQKHLGHDLPLYGTEQGYATKEDVSNELLQAQGLVRQNLIMAGEGCRFNYAFYIADYSGEPGYGFYYNLRPGHDFGTDKMGPKPVAPAYAAMTYLVDGHRPTKRIDWLAPTTLGYAFDRGGDVVLALWDYGDNPREVTIPVGVDRVTVFDWMGNAHVADATGGALRLTLTGDPIYIKGASASIWGVKARKLLSTGVQRFESFPGAAVGVVAQLAAGTAPLDGTLTLHLDPRLNKTAIVKPVSMKRGGKMTLRFYTPIPVHAEVGDYSATLVFKDRSGMILAGDGCRIGVNDPVSISGVSPIAGPNHCGLIVRIQDLRNRQLSGVVIARLDGVPGSKQSVALDLSAGQSKCLNMGAIDADISPLRIYRAIITVRTNDGCESSRTFPVDFLQAPKLRVSPTIDGDLTKWAAIPGASLSGREAVVYSPQFWTGNADLSAVVKYAWDDKALYLAVDATDDVFLQERTGFWTWRGDSLQIGIDVDNGRQIVSTGNLVEDNASRHRWSEITLALTKTGPEVYRTGSYDNSKVGPVSLAELPLAVVRTGVHTLYEAAIPWRTLGKNDVPKVGDRIGVALGVNDMDDPKQTDIKAIGLFGGMLGHKEIGDYGVLTLGEIIY